MRAFLISMAAMVVIAVISIFVLDGLQESSAIAYSTVGVRL
jgi:uncharacterized membrane protein